MSSPPDWHRARAEMMLDPNVVNLNTGSWGPTPRAVLEQATTLRQRLAAEPMNFYLREGPPLLWASRCRLADFLGTEPKRLVFTSNVSVAINMVAASLQLAAPGEILLTDHEYGAMVWCWERAAQRQGLTIRTFPLPVMASDPEEIVAAAVQAMTSRTRLLFFSHVLSPTGLVLPATRLCAAAKKRGILTVVDGAHAPAMVPLQLDELGCAFYGGNCHKWLLAPLGTGFLYLGKGNEDRLQPLQVSWGWQHDRSHLDEPDEFGSTPRIRHLEFEGTRDWAPWLSIPAAIAFQTRLGFEHIRARNEQLVRHIRRRVAEELRLTPWTPEHPDLHGFLTAFRLPAGADAPTLRRELWQRYRIEVPIVEKDYGLIVRVSTHFYNTEVEIDHLVRALQELGMVHSGKERIA